MLDPNGVSIRSQIFVSDTLEMTMGMGFLTNPNPDTDPNPQTLISVAQSKRYLQPDIYIQQTTCRV